MIPASVRSVPPDGTAERPLGGTLPTGSDLSETAMQPVVQDGQITHWPGFEALLYYTLYQQVSKTLACACCTIFLPVTDAYDYSWAGKLERKAV